MLLFTGHAIARAHRAAVLLAALADPHAAPGRLGEAETVAGEGEAGFRLWRPVRRAEPEVLVEAMSADHLPRIHLPAGIEDRLELLESVDEALSVHDGE